ncbi:MAG: DUF169 domain-containing protein [Candidatus Zixiibacteriota bacterium]
MDLHIRDKFIEQWNKYFPGGDLPLAFFYNDDPGEITVAPPIGKDWQCFICQLGQVRRGNSVAFNNESIGCGGAKRSLGFDPGATPHIELFLSCGLKGHVEGIRYKKTPKLVEQIMAAQPPFKAPGRYIMIKRWDRLRTADAPLAVIFYAKPEILAGLYGLAGFDEADPNAVICPSGAGCATIVYHPYHEGKRERPRAVLGMFDVSARPCTPKDTLTFAVPFAKFVRMIDNMTESFLITEQWDKVRERL